MTKEERQSYILDSLDKHERVHVTELAETLDVSVVTIRKDFGELEKQGRLYRSHGVAIKADPYINTRSVLEKEKLLPALKKKIGICAARLITPDDTIILTSGSTIQAFARCIQPQMQLTVVSACLNASIALASLDNVDVIQLGGTVRQNSFSVLGDFAKLPFANFSCSKMFLGVDGIDPDYGITTTIVEEAELDRVMMNAAHKVIVLADSSKFMRRGFTKIADITDVDIIVTDSGIPQSVRDQLVDKGVEIIIAE